MMLARMESSVRTGTGAEAALVTGAGGGLGILATATGAAGGVATVADAASATGAVVGGDADGVAMEGRVAVSGTRVTVSTGGVTDLAGGAAEATAGRPGVLDDAGTTGPETDGDTDLAATDGAALLDIRVPASAGGRG